MKNKSIVLMAFVATMLVWNSCNKDEKNVAAPDPENEVITTVKLVATNTADAADVVTAQWKDLTPNDGNPDLTQATLALKKDAVYNVEVKFLDETKSPAEDITEEVQERANYHLVCYAPASGLNVTVMRTDKDTNTPQMELGLKGKFTTGAASSGKLNISLHHQPSGKNGTDCGIGTTDVAVDFTVNVL
ncbi:MAG: hypothetical protein K9G49_09560 [Taibaiella sp.]|nr:hypothetical protein [Taibaiella sp.]